MSRQLYENEVARHLLALREALIRHDENAKALALMEDCAPFYLETHPAVLDARMRTWRQSGHVRSATKYDAYYSANAHERPFEEQTGLSVADAHRIPRLAFLRGALAAMAARHGGLAELFLLDLAGNDGAFAANLSSLPFPVTCDIVDLNPACVALARKRAKTLGVGIRDVECLPAESAHLVHPFSARLYDAVVAFELIEHVRDPAVLLEAMRTQVGTGGCLFVSTPCGVDHGGDLAGWDTDEPKGHVRVYTEASFRAELAPFGELVNFMVGGDGVMVAQVKP